MSIYSLLITQSVSIISPYTFFRSPTLHGHNLLFCLPYIVGVNKYKTEAVNWEQ